MPDKGENGNHLSYILIVNQKIDDLSREESGKLFPIEVVPYNEMWPNLFEAEKKLLIEVLGTGIVLRIEHFGSTSVPQLAAKPTIDILIEIPILTDELKESIIAKMKIPRYGFIWRADIQPPYMMFAKGYNLIGLKEQTYHVHMGPDGHPLWDRIYFRDYLRQNPEISRQYEKLKIELAEKLKHDREDYTNAKTDFITRVTKEAKDKLYKN